LGNFRGQIICEVLDTISLATTENVKYFSLHWKAVVDVQNAYPAQIIA